MKRSLTLFLFFTVICLAGLTAQFTITEIMYNPPESGQDSMEYIEITNTSDVMQNLAGYSFSQGVTHTFSSQVLFAGASMVIAVDSVALMTVIGVSARQWTDGALTNGGEDIVLVDPSGVQVDSVDYKTSAPWPSFADGTAGAGASIELCDVATDNNDGSNWAASMNDLGVEVDGKKFLGSPGEENTADCSIEVLFPEYPIAVVTSVNTDGVADSFGVTCQLEGIVYGINFRPGGLTFTIIDDANDGIAVFELSDDFGYTVTEGDRVEIDGQIDQFRGLTQIRPSEIRVLSQSNSLQDPTVLATEDLFGEDTESQLIELSGVSLIDPTEWRGDGTGFNVRLTNGVNEYLMRIDDATEMSSMPVPGDMSDVFRITGIGSQFNSSTSPPFLDGYQIFPRYASDLEIIVATKNERSIDFQLYPNPVSDLLIIKTEENIQKLLLRDITGIIVQEYSGSQTQLDVSSLMDGLYILQVQSADASSSQKFVIKR